MKKYNPIELFLILLFLGLSTYAFYEAYQTKQIKENQCISLFKQKEQLNEKGIVIKNNKKYYCLDIYKSLKEIEKINP